MTYAALHRWPKITAFCIAAIVMVDRENATVQQIPEGTDLSIELVDPKMLRVCADPRNLPFSNEKGEGFENKLAELFADKLQKKLDYMYFPQATGFVRMTLGAHRCDVIMGFPQGDELVQAPIPITARPTRWLPSKAAASMRSRRWKTAGSRVNISASLPARRRPPTWRPTAS